MMQGRKKEKNDLREGPAYTLLQAAGRPSTMQSVEGSRGCCCSEGIKHNFTVCFGGEESSLTTGEE